MIKGNWTDIDRRGDGIILGRGLAKKLSLGMNDFVMVNTGDGVDRNFKIIGILETSLVSVDNSNAYVQTNSARQLVSENRSYATGIQINIEDYNDANELAKEMDRLIDYKVESWIEANGQLQAWK